MKKSNKGVTLVELVIVLALLTFGIGIAVNMILFSRNAQAKTLEEFDFQSEMRQSSQVVNDEIRNSTVVFAVPQNTFNNKKAMWNYLGLEDSKTLVQYTWNEADKKHDPKILYKSDKDISLNLMFKKKNLDSKLIEFTLQGYIDGKSDPKMTIKSELEAFNSLVVEDGGTPSYPATALAYRTDDTPGPTTKAGKKVVAAVTLVLDESGSMDWRMKGEDSKPKNSTNPFRMTTLKNKANKLIDQFSSMTGNIYVSVIPYSYDATISKINNKDFTLANSINKETIKSKISEMSPNGATNTGDGMRISYYAMKNFKDNPTSVDSSLPSDTKVVNYMILLSDGNPTWCSYKDVGSQRYFFREPGIPQYYYNYGNDPLRYTEIMGKEYITGQDLDINTFVIGFSAVKSEIDKANSIAGYCNLSSNPKRNGKYYEASSDVQLEEVFDEIGGTILKEMWHIYGPYEDDESDD